MEFAVPDAIDLVTRIGTPLRVICRNLLAIYKIRRGFTIRRRSTTIVCVARMCGGFAIEALARHQLFAGGRDGQAAGVDGVAAIVLQNELHDGLLALEVGIARGSNLVAVNRSHFDVGLGVVVLLLNGVITSQHASLSGIVPRSTGEQQVQLVASRRGGS